MTSKVYCPCCGRFIGDYCATDGSTCKTTLEKPKGIKKKKCYITNICKRCKNEIYITMEFSEPETKTAEIS